MENLKITETIKNYLLSSTKWLKFLTIVAVVATAILLIAALILIASGIPQTTILGIAYLILVGLYVYPIIKCFNIICHTRKALKEASQDSLESAADNLHSLLKFLGILTIIVISLYIVIFLFGSMFMMNMKPF
ncbi:MAG: hypothetical protein Q4C30_00445 [Bacteroidia bacterium]|nr:hypothetical protein [Bacteroidia bacterium]